jgi:hypothetical protein
VIYDPNKKSYKDRITKDNAWQSIMTALECDGKFIIFSSSPMFIQCIVYLYLLYCFNIKKITYT